MIRRKSSPPADTDQADRRGWVTLLNPPQLALVVILTVIPQATTAPN
jgi:hypothetical protein